MIRNASQPGSTTIRLTREVRFSIPEIGRELDGPVLNSWGGWPTARMGNPFLVLRCTLAGQPDVASGYLCDIRVIDQAVRQDVIAAAVGRPAVMESFETFLKFAWQQLKARFFPDHQLVRLALLPNPWIGWSRNASSENMIYLTRQFEFSASHRLHNPSLSVEENKKLFGKCNNPHGHGHNYVVEVTLATDSGNQRRLAPEEVESVVKQRVIDRMDHRNLNAEVEEFRQIIPSVENIAVAIWDWLDGAISDSILTNVRVYETPKTWADYSGPSAT